MATYYVTPTGNDTTGDGSIGNPYRTPGKASGVATTSGDIIYLKAGNSTDYQLSTSTQNVSGGPVVLTNGVRLEGYETTAGDMGVKPTIHAGSQTGVYLIRTSDGNFNGVECVIVNISVDGNSGAGNVGIDTRLYSHKTYDCSAYNCTTGFSNTSNDAGLYRCYAESCTTGFLSNTSPIHSCVAKECSSYGFSGSFFTNCVAVECNVGFTGAYPIGFVNCIAYGSTSHGFATIYDIFRFTNCIAYGNGGYGFSISGSTGMLANCASGSNTSGRVSATAIDLDPILLTADPFVDAASGDFNLNNVSGGGALLRAVTYDMPG